MLVKFDSKAGTLTMFGEVAIHLLKLMGHSGTIPSAILAADIPAAAARLQKALDAGAAAPAPSQDTDDHEEGGPRISLRQRAYPLIELLQRAAAKGADVMWDRA
jgi:hypothetical protein